MLYSSDPRFQMTGICDINPAGSVTDLSPPEYGFRVRRLDDPQDRGNGSVTPACRRRRGSHPKFNVATVTVTVYAILGLIRSKRSAVKL